MKKAIAIAIGVAMLGPVTALAHHDTRETVVVREYDRHGVETRVVKKVVTTKSHKSKKKGRRNRHDDYRRYTDYRDYRDHREAEVYGRVVSVEPIYRTVTERVPQDSCVSYVNDGRRYRSHTGTVLGAVIGAAVGHRIGDNHGDPTAAAIAGGILGASLGRDISDHARQGRQLVVNGPCRPGTREVQRRELVEYDVRYRYNGDIYRTRMDHDPGEWVALDVDVKPV